MVENQCHIYNQMLSYRQKLAIPIHHIIAEDGDKVSPKRLKSVFFNKIVVTDLSSLAVIYLIYKP